MKKQLIIISGIVLAVIVGFAFYFISIPNDTSAAFPGAHNGNRCQGTATAEDGSTYSFDWPCSSIQEGGMVNCTEGATGAGSCSWGAYTGTQGTDVYFTQAHANAFLVGGGTAEQLNAIDGIYLACQNLIASKPTDPTMDPRTIACGDVKWKCDNNKLRCQNLNNGNLIGGLDPDSTHCADIQPGTGGGECGGERPSCGLTTGGGAVPVSGTTVGTNRNEYNLQVGSKGPYVTQIQGFLAADGYYTGKIDGSYGPGMAAAVSAWEKANGLKSDGVWNYDPREIWQGGSGKYYCRINGVSHVCIQEGQPTGASCDPLPPAAGQGCSYAGLTGTVGQGLWIEAVSNTPSSSL